MSQQQVPPRLSASKRFFNFILRRITLVLTLIFCVGVALAVVNMSRLSNDLIETQATQNARTYLSSFQRTIELYSSSTADRAKLVPGIEVTHTYLNQVGGIPLPSTFAIELGDLISGNDPVMGFRLYSDFPFPSRENGGARDDFEHEALTYLRENPRGSLSRREPYRGQPAIRYAEASLMQPTCVACHNTHPESPKTDWKVGDVAGAWIVNQPLNTLIDRVNQRLRGTLAMLGGFSVLGVTGFTLVIGKLRQTAQELEGRVIERTADLADANQDLEQRNQLIRQVFGRYMSDDIVANLLDNPQALHLGGERRRVTMLTSDLRGFTNLSESLPPEEVIRLINLYLSYMADTINQYQGTIDEIMGDGILVLFGALAPREDDALRAVACACAMQLAMGSVNEHLHQMGLAPLEMGIGINTGDVVVGNIGSEKRTKFGIVGNQVNLTYRIESYTFGGEILITEETLKAVGSTVKIQGRKQVQPKGVHEPLIIYEVYGVGGFYNLYLPQEEEIFLPLPEPLRLSYAVLEGKQISDTQTQGAIAELSRRSAVITLDAAMDTPAEFSNLKLNFHPDGDPNLTADLYAKVVGTRSAQGCFEIRFTAVPPNIQAYLDHVYHKLCDRIQA